MSVPVVANNLRGDAVLRAENVMTQTRKFPASGPIWKHYHMGQLIGAWSRDCSLSEHRLKVKKAENERFDRLKEARDKERYRAGLRSKWECAAEEGML